MCYLLVDETEKKAVLIDAPPDCFENISEKLIELELKLDAVLLTHSHWDHTVDSALFIEKMGAKVFIHKLDNYRLVEPMKHSLLYLPFEIKPVTSAEFLENGARLSYGSINLDVIHTPGHTEGSVCYYAKEQNLLFSGDTLFCEGIGRTDLPGGDTDKIFASIRNKLLILPEKTRVYPGHGTSTTIENELAYIQLLT
jgi:glyoxylase-like metal-dependent hydrolase (beta-lactamase superfamily II)